MSNTAIPQQSGTLAIDQALQKAIVSHHAGQLQEAELLYRAILQVQPKHADANHNLGVLAIQVNQPAVSLSYFELALEANPNQGQYWISYIDALIQAGQTEVARQVLEQGRQFGLKGDAIEELEVRFSFSEDQTNSLYTLISEELYAEAVELAESMTTRFPRYGLGWKALGVALKMLGQVEASLAPMQNAALLLPSDAEVYSNLGAIFYALGRLNEAETYSIKALERNQNFAEAHYNLGLSLMELGRLNEAETSYRQALKLKPYFAEAYNNLGNTLYDLRRLDEAEAHYRRALEIKPNFAEAYCNLGNVLHDLDRLCEAESSCRQALEIRTDFADAYYNLGNTLCALDDTKQAVTVYQKAMIAAPNKIGMSAAVYLALFRYLKGDFNGSSNLLETSKAIVETTCLKNENVRHYWYYLNKLLNWHRVNTKYFLEDNRKNIYVIGESHSLSAHRMTIRWHMETRQCSAEWIQGCKQWHLGSKQQNRYKEKFEAVIARLPPDSDILLTIGEIDCRHNEGIIKAWKKYPDRTLDDVIQSTIVTYLDYVKKIVNIYGHRVIVSGVPANNIPLGIITEKESEQLIYLLRAFNVQLKEQALKIGMDFLDVYALTDRGDGIANGEWHIDSRHLLPCAVVEAFDKYYISACKNIMGQTTFN